MHAVRSGISPLTQPGWPGCILHAACSLLKGLFDAGNLAADACVLKIRGVSCCDTIVAGIMMGMERKNLSCCTTKKEDF